VQPQGHRVAALPRAQPVSWPRGDTGRQGHGEPGTWPSRAPVLALEDELPGLPLATKGLTLPVVACLDPKEGLKAINPPALGEDLKDVLKVSAHQ